MELTIEMITEAEDIIRKGKDKCFSEADWYWAIGIIEDALNEGYKLFKAN